MRGRAVVAETLDGLAADDPAAIRSRADLRRIHRAMGTRSTLLLGLRRLAAKAHGEAPLRVLELGCGDGLLMLGVAQALAPAWPRVEFTLLDRLALVEPATIKRYAALNWVATQAVADVHQWAAAQAALPAQGSAVGRWDLIVANLFMHHFEGRELAALISAIAARTDRFFACEPRRAWVALMASHLVGFIGANAVTREDAVLSVHAGFRGKELSLPWPGRGTSWQTQEYSAGLFTHCFSAQRMAVH